MQAGRITTATYCGTWASVMAALGAATIVAESYDARIETTCPICDRYKGDGPNGERIDCPNGCDDEMRRREIALPHPNSTAHTMTWAEAQRRGMRYHVEFTDPAGLEICRYGMDAIADSHEASIAHFRRYYPTGVGIAVESRRYIGADLLDIAVAG